MKNWNQEYSWEESIKYFSLNMIKRGHSSGGRALSCKGLDPPASQINPAWQMQLQFGIYSIPTDGPQLVHQMLRRYVLSCPWESAYKNTPCCLLERVAYVATVGFLWRNMSQWPCDWRPIADVFDLVGTPHHPLPPIARCTLDSPLGGQMHRLSNYPINCPVDFHTSSSAISRFSLSPHLFASWWCTNLSLPTQSISMVVL